MEYKNNRRPDFALLQGMQAGDIKETGQLTRNYGHDKTLVTL
jgi:hypothetical protein